MVKLAITSTENNDFFATRERELSDGARRALQEIATHFSSDERNDHAEILAALQTNLVNHKAGLSTKRLCERIGKPYSRIARRLDWLLGRTYVQRSEKNSTGPEFEWTVTENGAKYLSVLVGLERTEMDKRSRRHKEWAQSFG